MTGAVLGTSCLSSSSLSVVLTVPNARACLPLSTDVFANLSSRYGAVLKPDGPGAGARLSLR